MLRLAEDPSDPSSEKAAFSFLGRCVTVWAELPKNPSEAPVFPGFERFVYERVVPTSFAVLALPDFNIRDGQIVVVCCCLGGVIEFIEYQNIIFTGPPRDCQPASDRVKGARPGGFRVFRQRLPPFSELATTYRRRVCDEDARTRSEGLPKILHGFRARVARRSIISFSRAHHWQRILLLRHVSSRPFTSRVLQCSPAVY